MDQHRESVKCGSSTRELWFYGYASVVLGKMQKKNVGIIIIHFSNAVWTLTVSVILKMKARVQLLNGLEHECRLYKTEAFSENITQHRQFS